MGILFSRRMITAAVSAATLVCCAMRPVAAEVPGFSAKEQAAALPTGAWPSFRGPGAAGVADEQDLPTSWNVGEGTNVVWKTPIAGLGNSSPVVWGDQVFITSAVQVEGSADEKPAIAAQRTGFGPGNSGRPVDDLTKHRWGVWCLALDDGRVLWQRDACEGVPHTKRHIKSSHANATPATDGKHVVVLFPSEGLFCYDIEGKLLWKQDLGINDAGAFDNKTLQWGAASSPILYDDLVIVQCDQQEDAFLAGYRVSTGKLIWRTPRNEKCSWSTPAVYRGTDRDELITLSPKFCRGYDPRTGQQLWHLSGFSLITTPTPIFAHGLIYVMSGYRPIQPIYAIRPGSSGDITPSTDENNDKAATGEGGEDGPRQPVAWSMQRGGAYTPTPLIYGDYLYVLRNNGAFSCYEAQTGKEVYTQRISGTGGYSASPVASDGKLYCFSEAGDVSVVQLGPKFELLATNKMDDICMASPAISRGKLLVRTEHDLIAIGAKPGASGEE